MNNPCVRVEMQHMFVIFSSSSMRVNACQVTLTDLIMDSHHANIMPPLNYRYPGGSQDTSPAKFPKVIQW